MSARLSVAIVYLSCVVAFSSGAQLLWDQISDAATTGEGSGRGIFNHLQGQSLPHYFNIADDFRVPSGVRWQLEEVSFQGYINEPAPNVANWTVEIFADGVTQAPLVRGIPCPGNVLFSKTMQSLNNVNYGTNLVAFNLRFDVTEAPLLNEGSYWISMFPNIDANSTELYQWYTNTADGKKYRESFVFRAYNYVANPDVFGVWVPSEQVLENSQDQREISFSISGTIIVREAPVLTCEQQWQCESVSNNYSFVACSNGHCQCRANQGFAGDATSSNKCNCPEGKSVHYFGGNAYCISPGQCIGLSAGNYQCETVSQHYSFVECVDDGRTFDKCQCKSGFSGAATENDKCRCSGTLTWDGNTPICTP